MASAKRVRKTAPRKPVAKTAAAPVTRERRPKRQDETVIVTVEGERVYREDFLNADSVDETVIVGVDGKRVNRRDYKE